MQTTPLLSLSPYPAADTLEIFKSNSTAGAFANGNNVFGNLVVNVTRETRLAKAAFAQETFRGSGAFGLQPTPNPSVTCTQSVQVTVSESGCRHWFARLRQVRDQTSDSAIYFRAVVLCC